MRSGSKTRAERDIFEESTQIYSLVNSKESKHRREHGKQKHNTRMVKSYNANYE